MKRWEPALIIIAISLPRDKKFNSCVAIMFTYYFTSAIVLTNQIVEFVIAQLFNKSNSRKGKTKNIHWGQTVFYLQRIFFSGNLIGLEKSRSNNRKKYRQKIPLIFRGLLRK